MVYKPCPECGKHNHHHKLKCAECGVYLHARTMGMSVVKFFILSLSNKVECAQLFMHTVKSIEMIPTLVISCMHACAHMQLKFPVMESYRNKTNLLYARTIFSKFSSFLHISFSFP